MRDTRKPSVLVGMSGGVDSSVTAALLKEQGYDVTGITMKIWAGADEQAWGGGSRHRSACYGPGEHEDIEDARRIAEKLDIPLHVVDLAEEYKTHVLNYFKEEYLRGRTPNPCVMCNVLVKFGFLLKKAEEMGLTYDHFATGHYVRKGFDENTGRYYIRKGIDSRKDQSYFLSFLSQEQLKKTMFPLGEYRKEDVIRLAQQYRLGVENKQESQDFIEAESYAVLFEEQAEPGPIFDTTGKYLGQHKGIVHYTIGQRKGLGISAPQPLYVVNIDSRCNSLTVGTEENLASKGFLITEPRFMLVETIDHLTRAKVKIRLTHKEAECLVFPLTSARFRVDFTLPQLFVTPGQVAVFYDEDRVLGGGIIDEVLK